MVKNIILLATIVFSGAFSTVSAQTSKQVNTDNAKPAYKFLDNISVEATEEEQAVEVRKPQAVPAVKKDLINAAKNAGGTVEGADALQFKYSLLLDVEVEQVKNINLLRIIEEWYGVRYRYGGATKGGIDCSALMQVFFTALYGVALPRTAKMQYDFSKRISRTELKEGDLLFFNTTGGVSHVGMYLTNNKFVHASSGGVTISDMFDAYYSKRLIGTGRVLDDAQASLSTSPNP